MAEAIKAIGANELTLMFEATRWDDGPSAETADLIVEYCDDVELLVIGAGEKVPIRELTSNRQALTKCLKAPQVGDERTDRMAGRRGDTCRGEAVINGRGRRARRMSHLPGNGAMCIVVRRDFQPAEA
jgi:hypothetical protein